MVYYPAYSSSKWSIVYFVIFMFLGRLVLLSIIVAELLQQAKEVGRKREIYMRTQGHMSLLAAFEILSGARYMPNSVSVPRINQESMTGLLKALDYPGMRETPATSGGWSRRMSAVFEAFRSPPPVTPETGQTEAPKFNSKTPNIQEVRSNLIPRIMSSFYGRNTPRTKVFMTAEEIFRELDENGDGFLDVLDFFRICEVLWQGDRPSDWRQRQQPTQETPYSRTYQALFTSQASIHSVSDTPPQSLPENESPDSVMETPFVLLSRHQPQIPNKIMRVVLLCNFLLLFFYGWTSPEIERGLTTVLDVLLAIYILEAMLGVALLMSFPNSTVKVRRSCLHISLAATLASIIVWVSTTSTNHSRDVYAWHLRHIFPVVRLLPLWSRPWLIVRNLATVVFSTVPAILLLLFAIYFYSVIGIEALSSVDVVPIAVQEVYGPSGGPLAGLRYFGSFNDALRTLFDLLVANDWNLMMEQIAADVGERGSVPYLGVRIMFTSFVFGSSIILLDLMMSLLLEAFSKHSKKNSYHVKTKLVRTSRIRPTCLLASIDCVLLN